MNKSIEFVKCPRCREDKLHPDEVMNALSRHDNETYICNDCGMGEAMEHLSGGIKELQKEIVLVYAHDMPDPIEVVSTMEWQEFKNITGKNNPIEIVHLPNPADETRFIVLCNEEGLLDELPLNRGSIVGNILIVIQDEENPEEFRGFRYEEEINLVKILMDHFLPRATKETKYPDPSATFIPMDDKQFNDYIETGKLPTENE